MAIDGKSVLAVVPARSGSKGIPGKNLLTLGGVSLIARAGRVVNEVAFIDARVLSTDSEEYAAEGRRYGLDVPFLRPAALSTDAAGAVETVQHALAEAEAHYARRFDIVLIIEPTSPLRVAEDIVRSVRTLLDTGADSVLTVSPVDSKFHPLKVFRLDGRRIEYYDPGGAAITRRQQLSPLYFRNGLVYALTRACVVDAARIITERSVAEVVERPVVNIDTLVDLRLAELLVDAGEAR
ncbi:MAG: acylneuraminate cytidylyltransferase family protein [Vicinamibacterales bacterium]